MGDTKTNRTFGHAPYKKSNWTRLADFTYKSATLASITVGFLALGFIGVRVGYFLAVEQPQAKSIQKEYAAALQEKEETEKKAGLR